MQTFLPVPSFAQSAMMLDRQRLGKQRVECAQILRALREGGGWSNHPAVRMWRGHESWLLLYMHAVIEEWKQRGYVNNMVVPWDGGGPEDQPKPPWLGDPAFHASHRSNLLRKDPAHYGAMGWKEGPDLPYVWPVP